MFRPARRGRVAHLQASPLPVQTHDSRWPVLIPRSIWKCVARRTLHGVQDITPGRRPKYSDAQWDADLSRDSNIKVDSTIGRRPNMPSAVNGELGGLARPVNSLVSHQGRRQPPVHKERGKTLIRN